MNSGSRQILLREALWPDDEDRLRQIRSTVFIDEQQVSADIEWDGRDSECIHVIAESDGQAVGCGRILPDGRIGRLAVLPLFRSQGVGAEILQHLLEQAMHRGDPSVYLHAQADAVSFYERAGFTKRGLPFDEAGIQHLDMHLQLDYTRWEQPLARVQQTQPFADLVVSQAHFSRRELRILSPTLDHQCFDREPLRQAVMSLVRQGARSSVMILIKDVRPIVQRGHTLLELARRVPSSIQIRWLAEHQNWSSETLVIRDRDGLLSQSGREHTLASYHPTSRAKTAAAIEKFSELWQASSEHPELRSLSI